MTMMMIEFGYTEDVAWDWGVELRWHRNEEKEGDISTLSKLNGRIVVIVGKIGLKCAIRDAKLTQTKLN